jgi:hypothetical protein
MAPSGIKLSRSFIKLFRHVSVSTLFMALVLYVLLKSQLLLFAAYVTNTLQVIKNSKADSNVQVFHELNVFFILVVFLRE